MSQEASDHDQLRRLVADYCHLLDDRELETWLQLFTDDAVVRMGRTEFTGHDGVRQWIDAILKATAEPGRHLCTNVALDVNGDRATGRCDFAYIAPGPSVVQVGRYDDEYRRVDGRWHIAVRRLSLLPPPS